MIKKTDKESYLYIIEHNQNLYDCLIKFEENNAHTLLVKNNNKIIGTVTDGDIRKALIRYRTLQTKVNLVMNMSFVFATSDNQCEELFDNNKHVVLIPVLNQQRELISIFLRY